MLFNIIKTSHIVILSKTSQIVILVTLVLYYTIMQLEDSVGECRTSVVSCADDCDEVRVINMYQFHGNI